MASVEDQCLELEAQEGSFLCEVGLGWVCLVEAAPPFQFMRPWATPTLHPFFVNGLFVSRAKMVTVPELWATPPEVKEKIHLLYQKSEFVEKRVKHFLGRWACRTVGGAPSPALKSRVAQTPWYPFSIFLVLPDSAFSLSQICPHLGNLTRTPFLLLEILRSEVETFNGEYGGGVCAGQGSLVLLISRYYLEEKKKYL